MENRYKIYIKDTGEEFFCAEDQYLFAAMRRARTGPVEHGCHGGGCGICKMRLETGQINVAKRMSRAHISYEEEAQGYILTCCVQPRSDLVLAQIGARPTSREPVGGDKGETIIV